VSIFIRGVVHVAWRRSETTKNSFSFQYSIKDELKTEN
jgi:hypothetical protein